MKFFGTITGLPAAAATPTALPGRDEEGPKKPDLRALLLLCAVGAAVCVGLVYLVGRKKKGSGA